ncbi:hypothetical protein M8J75_000454 [Diaphorina citri]|nr:hypothetical protein M8J75_000454 [Diaphorina citri]
MADVDVQVQYTTTKVRKTKKTTSGKRRESTDQGSEVTITEVQDKENYLVNGKGEDYNKLGGKDRGSGQHFCCWQCDESLTGQRYVLRDDHPYCIKCYESVFANSCEECSKIIGIDSKDLSYKDKHWHEACFSCSKCRQSLVDKQFGSKSEKIYCGNCYDAQFASRCDGCSEIFKAGDQRIKDALDNNEECAILSTFLPPGFEPETKNMFFECALKHKCFLGNSKLKTPGTKKMEYKTRQWHEKCFACVVCKTPIGTKSFIPREQEIYCANCYEEKFATRCVKCNKRSLELSISLSFRTSLAGQRFTSREDKPFCADCFGELFAKRCYSCKKPITGIGGTRFISFEDRHWHNDCFMCASCQSSLVGRGFITDGEDIICPDCAKAKLM